ncbi:hypothetical protein [Cronobacter dublinensis]|uniref:hypothetical protein n=1 Tax=Cronobacter dublinensis TaxID=413497 RepID=UPI000CFB8EA4|nr:hypothetical protein [Cronobacter dublinensis]
MHIEELITLAHYRSFLDRLEQQLGQPVGRVPLEEGLSDFYDHCLELAGLDASALLAITEQQREASLRYIGAKLEMFAEPEGGKDNIVNEPLPLTLPLGHLIEFALLEQGDGIAAYLRQLRIPRARQYGKQISTLFTQLRTHDQPT